MPYLRLRKTPTPIQTLRRRPQRTRQKKSRLAIRMKQLFIYILAILVSAISQAQNKLWYTQPAQIWTEALPIGNGNLGAMIYGGVQNDHLQLNESTFCTGRPRSY